MVDFTERRHSHEFIVSEANGYRSRSVGTVVSPDGGLEAGTLLAADGTPATAAGPVASILVNPTFEAGTTEETLFARDGEVDAQALIYPDPITPAETETLNTQLAALGIVVRQGGVLVGEETP